MELDEIKKHNSKNDCWIIINNNGYDVTSFLNDHPGGKNILLEHSNGMDASEVFNTLHSSNVLKEYNSLKIGVFKHKKIKKEKFNNKSFEYNFGEEGLKFYFLKVQKCHMVNLIGTKDLKVHIIMNHILNLDLKLESLLKM